MKKVFILAAAALVAIACNTEKPIPEYGYAIKDGTVVFNIPPRPADQQSMLQFKCAPIDTVRVGFVGIGSRGSGAVRRWTKLDGVKIVALCDKYEDAVKKNQKMVVDAGLPEPDGYWGEEAYKELCERDDIDLIYIATCWQMHTPVALYALEHGKHAVTEVPTATSLKECWDLVNTAERVKKHCGIIENCCYDFFELTTLNLVQKGMLGEVIHGEGSYQHNLDPFWDYYKDDWRMEFNRDHKGDLYGTHGLGPVAQCMGIHRGDKFNTLVAMETAPFRGQKIADKRYGEGKYDYQNGDNTMTLISTEKGKTILIEHQVTIPRPYSRMFQITGVDGFANKYYNNNFALNINGHDAEDFLSPEELAQVNKEYQHPILTDELIEAAKKDGGHGGMDFIMDYRLVYCLHNGLPLDIDVYDTAEWCCIGELGEISIKNGNIPVQIPDFTRGEWNKIQGYHHAMKQE